MGDDHRTKKCFHLRERDEKTVHCGLCEGVGLNGIIGASSAEFKSHQEITVERHLLQLRMFQNRVENPHMDPVCSQIASPITNKNIFQLRSLRYRRNNPISSPYELGKLNRNALMGKIMHANDSSSKKAKSIASWLHLHRRVCFREKKDR